MLSEAISSDGERNLREKESRVLVGEGVIEKVGLCGESCEAKVAGN